MKKILVIPNKSNIDKILETNIYGILLPIKDLSYNLSIHRLVEDTSLIKIKNQRGLVRKIKLFIEFLNNNEEFNTTYINVGDKISISNRKED